MNLGVDVFARQVTPARYQPGMGLRPGGERPDLEPLLPALYGAFYDSVIAHSRHGLHVVVDVGHHDGYSHPLGLLQDAARRMAESPAFLIGVRCPVPVVVERRAADSTGSYSISIESAQRWEDAVHRPGVYDLEVDTSVLSPEQCASAIRDRLPGPPPTALRRVASTHEGE